MDNAHVEYPHRKIVLIFLSTYHDWDYIYVKVVLYKEKYLTTTSDL